MRLIGDLRLLCLVGVKFVFYCLDISWFCFVYDGYLNVIVVDYKCLYCV